MADKAWAAGLGVYHRLAYQSLSGFQQRADVQRVHILYHTKSNQGAEERLASLHGEYISQSQSFTCLMRRSSADFQILHM